VTTFQNEDSARKPLSTVQWSAPFNASYCSGPGGACPFPTDTFESVRTHGAIPFFSWANSGITDQDVADGKYDSYLTGWAQAARAWGHPFFLRFDWEMNGPWFSWGLGNPKIANTAQEYVAAWRHVHDIFSSVGATNVTWVWCPNVDPGGKFADLPSLYPGNSYVDWTCLDGYNGNTPWTSFTNLFATSYDLITGQIAPTKPMILGEVGSTEAGGNKAQWISDMFAALPTRFPKIRGLLWFEKAETGPGGYTDWPVESSTTSQAAFAAGIATSAFSGGGFSALPSGVIQPP
jgi:Glycosyl hydrolase family 26